MSTAAADRSVIVPFDVDLAAIAEVAGGRITLSVTPSGEFTVANFDSRGTLAGWPQRGALLIGRGRTASEASHRFSARYRAAHEAGALSHVAGGFLHSAHVGKVKDRGIRPLLPLASLVTYVGREGKSYLHYLMTEDENLVTWSTGQEVRHGEWLRLRSTIAAHERVYPLDHGRPPAVLVTRVTNCNVLNA